MATAKIQTVKGAEWRFFAKQKILLGLDGLDSRNGRRTGIACGGEMCYTWVSKLTDKVRFRGRIMARRKKLGDIIEIPLPDGRNAYARLYKEYTLGIYRGKYSSYDDVPKDAGFFRFICLYRGSLSKLQVVGSKPFANDEDSWAPDRVVVDAITGRGSLYHHGEILKCTYEECKDLEVCAVWELSHLIDMLMGDTKIDCSIRRPKDV